MDKSKQDLNQLVRQFIDEDGRDIWNATREHREGTFHARSSCPSSGPKLLGGDGACADCESQFGLLIVELMPKWQKKNGSRWAAGGGGASSDGVHGFNTGAALEYELAKQRFIAARS